MKKFILAWILSGILSIYIGVNVTDKPMGLLMAGVFIAAGPVGGVIGLVYKYGHVLNPCVINCNE